MKFRKWLYGYLATWAKDTILAENEKLHAEVERLRKVIDTRDAYIRGLENGIKAQRRIIINTTGEVKK